MTKAAGWLIVLYGAAHIIAAPTLGGAHCMAWANRLPILDAGRVGM
jgi:hypothetical protein